MQFVADLEPTDDGSLQIMYGIDGRRDLTETTLDHLTGYAGAQPVRIGNGAFDQRQNDVFGAVLDSILLHTREASASRAASGRSCRVAGRVRDARLAGARPGNLGGARRAAALRLLEDHVLGRARPRRQARRDPRRRATSRRSGAATAEEIRADVLAHGVSDARRAAPALRRPTRSTPRRCWPRSSASCRPTTSGSAPRSRRSPTSSPSTASSCATAPRRPTTGSPARRGRS